MNLGDESTQTTSDVDAGNEADAAHRESRVIGSDVLHRIDSDCESADRVRRGVCLINAGKYDDAIEVFAEAIKYGSPPSPMPVPIAASLRGDGKPAPTTTKASSFETNRPTPIETIRHAIRLADSGDPVKAVALLRAGIADNPECAALHYHLGTLLSTGEEYEEAELRFTQALSIDRKHVDAMVGLAMCAGVSGRTDQAIDFLQRAQSLRPGDARIGLLLAQAARTARQEGRTINLRPAVVEEKNPTEGVAPINPSSTGDAATADIIRRIETDPDVLDAFTAMRADRLDKNGAEILLSAVQRINAKNSGFAEYRYHAGRLLARLGREEEAVRELEVAVQIDPGYLRALIELGRVLLATGRGEEAATRFEQAILAGGDYADVFYDLGNAYKSGGKFIEARAAYRRALDLNGSYEAAMKALTELPT